MITKGEISFVKSLNLKKCRNQAGQFIAEGLTLVEELLSSNLRIEKLYATAPWMERHPDVKAKLVSDTELERLSLLKSPNEVLGIVNKPVARTPLKMEPGLVLALDDIRDPGNMGAIIRTADWFGVSKILVSSTSVDVYNPKVVQATMGSIGRVEVVYGDLMELLGHCKITHKIYCASMSGSSLFKSKFDQDAVIVLGNEAHGVSKRLDSIIDHFITIPSLGKAESLNVAIACAIFCADYIKVSK